MSRFRDRRSVSAILVLAAILIGFLVPVLPLFDRSLFDLLAMRRGLSPISEIAAAQDVTTIGNLAVRAVILIVGLLVFALRRMWREVFSLLVVALIAAGLTDAIKALFVRPRPAIYPYIGEFSNYSFPSGHASNTMALLLALGLLSRNRAFTMLCVVIALAVGTTRVMLDVHWPTDVIGGWLLGAGVALVGAELVESKRRQV